MRLGAADPAWRLAQGFGQRIAVGGVALDIAARLQGAEQGVGAALGQREDGDEVLQRHRFFAAKQQLEDVQRPVDPLDRRNEADHPQVEGAARQLVPAQGPDVDRVRNQPELLARPAIALDGLLEEVGADEDDRVDPVDVDAAGVVGRAFHPVKANGQALVIADVLAVPDGVPEAPFAERHIGPLDQCPARLGVVLGVAGPMVLADLGAHGPGAVRNP